MQGVRQMQISRKDLYWTKLVTREIEGMAKSKYKFRSLSVFQRTWKDPFGGNNCTYESKIADTMHKFTNLVVTTSSIYIYVYIYTSSINIYKYSTPLLPRPELTLDLENPWKPQKSSRACRTLNKIFAVSHINKLVLYVVDESGMPCVRFCQQ